MAGFYDLPKFVYAKKYVKKIMLMNK